MKTAIISIPDVSAIEYSSDNPTRLTEELSKVILVNLKQAQDLGYCFAFPSMIEPDEMLNRFSVLKQYLIDLANFTPSELIPEPPECPPLDDMIPPVMDSNNFGWILSLHTFGLFARLFSKAGLFAVLKKALLTPDGEESLLYLLQRFPNKVVLGYNEIDFAISET
jgi:hypothetical protein